MMVNIKVSRLLRRGETEESHWDYYMGRLADLIVGRTNDLTDEKQDYTHLLEGTYRSSDGYEMAFDLNPERDKYNRKTWTWTRNTDIFPVHKEIQSLPQIDGVGAGHESKGYKSRVFLDIVDDKAVGIYYFCSRSISMVYLIKKSE